MRKTVMVMSAAMFLAAALSDGMLVDRAAAVGVAYERGLLIPRRR